MSLSVDVFVVGTDGKMQVVDVPEGSSDLAGFESWRTTVWGTSTVRSLGARFFPVLADGDLRVEPGQAPAFSGECALLREHFEEVVAGSVPVRTVEELRRQVNERLANIEDAAKRAQEIGGGVLIW